MKTSLAEVERRLLRAIRIGRRHGVRLRQFRDRLEDLRPNDCLLGMAQYLLPTSRGPGYRTNAQLALGLTLLETFKLEAGFEDFGRAQTNRLYCLGKKFRRYAR